jgi:chemotaxis protein CheY-P-specific phosphatase CheC
MDNLTQHISAVTEIMNILVADISNSWTAEKRERVQKMMWKFTINKGLESIIAKGNPFTPQELDALRLYARQAQEGQIFTPEQATHFRQLSEKASSEYPNQDWVGELLKIALFIFAIYAVSKLLKSD